MIFRLTDNAKNQLKLSMLDNKFSNLEKVFFNEFNINLVTLNRKKYFMITESKTLFTIIHSAIGIKSVFEFEALLSKIFTDIFNNLIEGNRLERLDFKNSIYAKTENNYVRRSQIDHLYHAKRLLEKGENTFGINRFPIASIGFQFPEEYFIKELGKILGQDGFIFVEDVLKN